MNLLFCHRFLLLLNLFFALTLMSSFTLVLLYLYCFIRFQVVVLIYSSACTFMFEPLSLVSFVLFHSLSFIRGCVFVFLSSYFCYQFTLTLELALCPGARVLFVIVSSFYVYVLVILLYSYSCNRTRILALIFLYLFFCRRVHAFVVLVLLNFYF